MIKYVIFFISHRGVRQGENLSPFFFSMCVNDFEEYMLKNRSPLVFNKPGLDLYLKLLVLMFADHTVILGQIEEGIHQALRALEKYCSQWNRC